jgi:hypothetical protein
MIVTRGLVIDAPWIDLILSGEKTWEMRTTAASHRGWFGLIRKGSGAVYGVAHLDESGTPLSTIEMLATVDRHRIPEHAIRDGAVAKWTTPWKLSAVKRLVLPIQYRHKPGAVTWVLFDDDVSKAIALQLGADPKPSQIAAPSREGIIVKANSMDRAIAKEIKLKSPTPLASSIATASSFIGETELNAANIGNNHFYMKGFIGRFPAALIGGSNKAAMAPKTAAVDWGGAIAEETDIDGTKGIFRKRGWIGRFFADNDAAPGDKVCVEETAPYRYRVSLIKRRRS